MKHHFSPHNSIIQFLLEFGIFGGSVVSCIFIYPIFVLHKIQNIYLSSLILVFFSCSIVYFFSEGSAMSAPVTAIYLFLFYYRNILKKFKYCHDK